MLIQHPLDYRKIEVSHSQHITHQVTLTGGIQIDTIPYHLIVGQTDHAWQTFQAFDINGVGEINILLVIMAIFVHFRKILHVPGMQQTVYIGIQAFRYQAHYVRQRVCR